MQLIMLKKVMILLIICFFKNLFGGDSHMEEIHQANEPSVIAIAMDIPSFGLS